MADLGSTTNGLAIYQGNGNLYYGGSNAYGPTYTTGDVIGILVDAGAGVFEARKNGVVSGGPIGFSPSALWFAMGTDAAAGAVSRSVTTNFGASAFLYQPSGYSGLYA